MTAKEGWQARVDKGLSLCYNGLKRGCGKGARLMPADVLSEIILEVTL